MSSNSSIIQDLDVAIELLGHEADNGQTVLHCALHGQNAAYRIWPSTFLITDTGKTYKLLHAENITFYPEWTIPPTNRTIHYFTLIFENLGNDTNWFYLHEHVEGGNGFYTNQITKNKTNIYHVQIFFENYEA
jgi:hypothetical protein